jgi:hypothetical protein
MDVNVHNAAFSEVQGRHWNLTEVKHRSVTINIDRDKAPIDIYTIKFESTNLVGAGAVNFYSASYVARNNHTLAIIRFARTCSDALYEMKNFTEHEYFRHLQRTSRWDIRNGKLELYTYDDYGAGVVLIYSQ